VQNTLEGKLSVIECDSGNVEVQWNNIKECVLDTLSDVVGKVEKIARKAWITQEIISKMEERMRWENVKTEEGRKNYRRLRNELKRATDNAKKEYVENICNVYTQGHIFDGFSCKLLYHEFDCIITVSFTQCMLGQCACLIALIQRNLTGCNFCSDAYRLNRVTKPGGLVRVCLA
jgi:hypothetical protein